MACSTTEIPKFTAPSTYRFNSPNLIRDDVYALTINDNVIFYNKLVDTTLGSFDRSKSVISDSLNRLIFKDYAQGYIKNIHFISNDSAKIEIAKLDTIRTDTIIESIFTKCTFNGNDLTFDKLFGYKFVIDNDFFEINLCQLFSFRSIKTATVPVKRYFKNFCIEGDDGDIIRAFVIEDLGIIYDTISLEFVNYIYTKY